jgi:putative ABC transport system permease protein
VRAIDRKLLRDVLHLKGQLIAVSLVVMCGIAMFITMRGAYLSLAASQRLYYRRFRLGDVFAHMERAPLSVARAIEQIPGVSTVDPRIVFDVMLDVPGLAEPATGRLVSIPEGRHPRLNDIHLRRGRWIDPERQDEVILSEAFAQANHLQPGSTIAAVMNGRWRSLSVAGIGLSPEYVYEVRASAVFPDSRRFGVIWIGRKTVQNAFSMEGAFNDLSLSVSKGTSTASVVEKIDRLLAQYGGTGAYDREQQISNRFLSDEIQGLRVGSTIVPAIFLGVAAFLIHIVLSRLIQTQRDQIAVLKAFGYSTITVGLHYLGIALVSVAVGSILGILVGVRLGIGVANLYRDFFQFPIFVIQLRPALFLGGIAISAASAAAGALLSVRSAVKLPPAEAMRPEAPPRFHAGIIERSRLFRAVPAETKIIVRNLLRRRMKAALSILGVALAVAILVVGRYTFDAMDSLMYTQFSLVERADLTVPFALPRDATAADDLKSYEGVLRVEPYRALSVKIEHENFSRRTGVIGLEPGSSLHRLVGKHGEIYDLPPAGLVLNRKLAELLHVSAGDTVTLRVLESTRPVVRIRVSKIVDEMIGISAYMDLSATHRLLGEGEVISGAWLLVDPLFAGRIYRKLKETPAAAGVNVRRAAIQSFKETIAESQGITNISMIVFACVIAAGVIYNGARIALSERSRELASLRVLGFTRAEVGRMLIGEQALLTLAAIPFGFALGYWLCSLLTQAYSSELYRMPLVVTTGTYAFAFGVVALAAIASSLIVLQRIRTLDLIEVLKMRE